MGEYQGDTWIVNGERLNASDFGNYFAGYTLGSLSPLELYLTLLFGELYSHEPGGGDTPRDVELINRGALDGRARPWPGAGQGCGAGL